MSFSYWLISIEQFGNNQTGTEPVLTYDSMNILYVLYVSILILRRDCRDYIDQI